MEKLSYGQSCILKAPVSVGLIPNIILESRAIKFTMYYSILYILQSVWITEQMFCTNIRPNILVKQFKYRLYLLTDYDRQFIKGKIQHTGYT